MINRISEIPFWGPEEQIRRFVNQHDEMLDIYRSKILKDFAGAVDRDGNPIDKEPSVYTDEQWAEFTYD